MIEQGNSPFPVATRRTPAHDAASRNDPKLAKWNPPLGSADADVIPELGMLSSRSRDLGRNNPVAVNIKQKIADKVVGHQLQLLPMPAYRLLGKDRQWAHEWAQHVADRFNSWAGTGKLPSTECDAANKMGLRRLARQALVSASENGGALTLPIWQPERPGAKWATRLLNVEIDRLQTPYWLRLDPRLRGGVQIDDYGAPEGYWLTKYHPGDATGGIVRPEAMQYEFLPAFSPWGRRRVIHLHKGEGRIGMSRDVPLFTSVIGNMNTLGRYLEHELGAAAANAIWAAILETNLDQDSVRELFGSSVAGGGTDGGPASISDYFDAVQGEWNGRDIRSYGNKILTPPLGTKFQGFAPNRPNVAFGPFVSSVSRLIALGTGLPYEQVFNDFAGCNYSNARTILNEGWDFVQSMRQWLAEDWLNAVYGLWFEEAVNAGEIEAPDFYGNQAAWLGCAWLMSGRGYVDQTKEAEAQRMRMENGTSDLAKECAEQGEYWVDMLERQALIKKTKMEICAAHGLPPDALDPPPAQGRAAPPPHLSDAEQTPPPTDNADAEP